MNDYDKLRELAQAATAGPWEVGVPDFDREWVAFTHEYGTSGDPDGTVTTSNGRGKLNVMADAEFIAAANPDAILNLLEDLRLTRVERDAEKHKCLEYRKENAALRRGQGRASC